MDQFGNSDDDLDRGDHELMRRQEDDAIWRLSNPAEPCRICRSWRWPERGMCYACNGTGEQTVTFTPPKEDE